MKPGWTMVALGDLATVNPRGDELDDAAPVSFVGMAQLDGTAARAVPLETRPFHAVAKGYTKFRNGDLLLAKITPCWENGKIGVASLDCQHGAGSTEFHVVRPKSAVDAQYLLHFLRQARVIDTGTMRMTGSGGQRRVPAQFVKDLQIPLPPIEEQRRIASLLQRGAKLMSAVGTWNEHQRLLLMAGFARMLTTHSSEVKTRALADMAVVTSGITKGRRVTGATREVPYLAVANVQDGSLELGSVKSIEATETEIERYRLEEGDLLLTEGGDPDKLGRGALWQGELAECLHQNHLFRVRTDREQILPEYLAHFVMSRAAKTYFLKNAKQTTGIASINMRQLKALPVPVLPMEHQLEFAARLKEAESLGRRRDSAAVAVAELFASLQSRAFRGEL